MIRASSRVRPVAGGSPGPSGLADTFRDKLYVGCSALLRERFLRALGNASRTQHRLLLGVLSENADTAFGQDHGFGRISSVDGYRRAVPLRSHEDLEGSIRRVAAGEPNVLTRAPVDYLQLTSGSTTGRRRMVPSNPVYRRERRAATLVGQGMFNRWADERGIRRGPGLAAVASLPIGFTDGGIPYGTASTGHALGARRFWGWFSVTPYAATAIADPEDRRYALWRYALLAERISFVGAPFMAYLDTFVDFVVEIDRTADPARYRLWAEPSGHAPLGALRAGFDVGLRSASADYAALRDRGEIGAAAVEILPLGTFYRFRRRSEREGGPAEQLKILHSSADPGYVAMVTEEAPRRPSPRPRRAPGTAPLGRADGPSPSTSS